MSGRWPVAFFGSVAAHVLFFGVATQAWPDRAAPPDDTTASVEVLEEVAPSVTIEAEITEAEARAAQAGGGASGTAASAADQGQGAAPDAAVEAEVATAVQKTLHKKKVTGDAEAQKRHRKSKKPTAAPEPQAKVTQATPVAKKVKRRKPAEATPTSTAPAAPTGAKPGGDVAAAPDTATRIAAAPTPAPPPPPPEEIKKEDARKSKKEQSSRGSGAGKSPTFKFARTAAATGGEPGAEAEYIGDHDASAPKNTRVATTTERSSGNARGSGDTLPVPEGHVNDDKGPLAHIAIAAPSPEARLGDRSTAGQREGSAPTAAAPPAGPHLSFVGDVSDGAVKARHDADHPPITLVRRKRKPAPAAKVTAPVERPVEAPLPPAPSPTAEELLTQPLPTPSAPAPVVAAADGFWAGEGAAEAGAGTAAADSPDPTAGDNVLRTVFKKDGAGWTEVTALEDAVEIGDQAAVSVRQTELGTWFTPVDDLVRLGWRPPLDQLVLGVGGRVTVEFTVRRNGHVAEVALVDANVPLALQEAALAAVPDAVAPPPAGYAPLRVRYVFRYGTSGGKLK